MGWHELGLEMDDVESSLKSKDGLGEVSVESAAPGGSSSFSGNYSEVWRSSLSCSWVNCVKS